jgi:hypothetical protein
MCSIDPCETSPSGQATARRRLSARLFPTQRDLAESSTLRLRHSARRVRHWVANSRHVVPAVCPSCLSFSHCVAQSLMRSRGARGRDGGGVEVSSGGSSGGVSGAGRASCVGDGGRRGGRGARTLRRAAESFRRAAEASGAAETGAAAHQSAPMIKAQAPADRQASAYRRDPSRALRRVIIRIRRDEKAVSSFRMTRAWRSDENPGVADGSRPEGARASTRPIALFPRPEPHVNAGARGAHRQPRPSWRTSPWRISRTGPARRRRSEPRRV